jgi:alkanesulfonate monooxygenase SsuD/methylene tetrahydromethanopterin reductase-like flavin-dependent oxidoreductase (luciferase family)
VNSLSERVVQAFGAPDRRILTKSARPRQVPRPGGPNGAIMELEFGIFDTFPEAAAADLTAHYEQHVADAAMCEGLGYRYYFFIEHQNARFPVITSPAVYLGAVAAATRTLRMGAMVFQLPMHHPIRLAQDVAMVDHLSRGRIEFALGYGTRSPEFRPWFADFEHRREIGLEVMEVVQAAWSGKEVTYEGEYFRYKDAVVQPHPFQKPHPPIWVGGHSPTSIAYAAENGFHFAQNLDAEKTIAAKFKLYREKLLAYPQHGPTRTLIARHVHVAETDALARKAAEPYMLEGLLGQQGVTRALNLRPEEKNPEMLEMARLFLETSKSYDFWIDEGLAFVGSPETVARRIREQQELCGYDILLAHHQITSMPYEISRRSMQLFGEAVIPQFRKTTVATGA